MSNIPIDNRARNSLTFENEMYFYTATINNWYFLLNNDNFKQIIIDSLTYLSKNKLLKIYAFVIMPNHIHLIVKILKLNGKENPLGSFLKYTAHEFKKKIKNEDALELEKYKVNKSNKNYEFWQRDPLAKPIFTKDFFTQKLNYIHQNPVKDKWMLAQNTKDYKFSSASFYENNNQDFAFLMNGFEIEFGS